MVVSAHYTQRELQTKRLLLHRNGFLLRLSGRPGAFFFLLVLLYMKRSEMWSIGPKDIWQTVKAASGLLKRATNSHHEHLQTRQMQLAESVSFTGQSSFYPPRLDRVFQLTRWMTWTWSWASWVSCERRSLDSVALLRVTTQEWGVRAAEIACLDSRVSSLSFLSLSSAACIILRLCHSIRLPAVHHLAARSESNPHPLMCFFLSLRGKCEVQLVRSSACWCGPSLSSSPPVIQVTQLDQ